jgi:Domain of unknown function (DUF4157)
MALRLQPKLTVSHPGDPFEREADAVADQVMTMPEPASTGTSPLAIQRRCAECEEEQAIQPQRSGQQETDTALDPTAALRAAQRGGTPLPADLRAHFEPRFGGDFSHILVHTDGEAATAARAVQARAYTAGRDIVFGPGEYAPSTNTGRRLLAHELAHVVQQSGGAAANAAATRPPVAVQREEDKTCRMRNPIYGWDNIRNHSREQLTAAGFVFCGTDPDYGALWEKWVHPRQGVLHFQVKWKDQPDDNDDRQKRCADPCMDQSDDEDSCKECCESSIPADDTKCRRTCDAACSLKL